MQIVSQLAHGTPGDTSLAAENVTSFSEQNASFISHMKITLSTGVIITVFWALNHGWIMVSL